MNYLWSLLEVLSEKEIKLQIKQIVNPNYVKKTLKMLTEKAIITLFESRRQSFIQNTNH